MFKRKKKITHRDYDEDVRLAMMEAQRHSEDPMEQFLWLKNNRELNPKQQILNMVNLIQMNFNVHTSNKVTLSDGHIDTLMRAMGDSINHMQEDLPWGVYNYIKKNSEDALEEIMKQRPDN